MSKAMDRRGFLAGVAGLGVIAPLAPALGREKRFTTRGDQFLLDGKPLQILAGEMHYPRIARADWRDRLKKLKCLGLNTLSAYVFWNAHEKTPGVYDFSGNLDVAAWIRMAQEEGLHVLLRPGPYVCAEWDGGGLPAWLCRDPSVRVRSRDPAYLKPAARWLKRLGAELAPLEVDRGGPILMTQVENEYGSFGADHAYMRAAEAQIRAAGFSGPLYTVDGASVLKNGALPHLINGINFGTGYNAEKEFEQFDKFKPGAPRINSELWDGWFDHFGEMHAVMPVAPLLKSLKWMMERKVSISFYMAHGGTSFGFTAGANFDADSRTYQPDISSYDYDAVFDEAGRTTEKFRAVQALFKNYLPPERFAPEPVAQKSIEIPRFRLTECAGLPPLLQKPVPRHTPQTLEALGQSHGLMLYRRRMEKDAHGSLAFADVRDYAVVFVAGKSAGVLDRRLHQTRLDISVKAGEVLEILVDTMGHVNYGAELGRDQKGLIGPVTLNGVALDGWEHRALPLDTLSGLQFTSGVADGPAFYRATVQLKDPGYCFLDMRGWGKGYVWVNGHNLGRHWNVGPQRALFVPQSFWKPGDNEIIVFDMHPVAAPTLAAGTHQIWDLS